MTGSEEDGAAEQTPAPPETPSDESQQPPVSKVEAESASPEPPETGNDAKPEASEPAKRRESWGMTLAKLLVKSLVCAFLLWLFVFQISFVKGESMEPSFRDGDRLVIDKLTFRFWDPARFDVVVFHQDRSPFDVHAAHPEEAVRTEPEDYIKRIVGLPGDQIRILRGTVVVNGRALEEPHAKHTARSRLEFYPPAALQSEVFVEVDATGMYAVRVKSGHVFVLGDNRGHSTDSRDFGMIPIERIRGKVRLRILPFDRWQWFAGGE